MNFSVATAMLVFLVNPGSEWAGDTVVNYKMAELEKLPEVHEASYTSWERFTEGEDVLRVSGFRMVHDLVSLETGSIEAPFFSDWLKIGNARADIPGREMVWAFDALKADFASERRGVILTASVLNLTYQGAPFEFEPQEDANLAELYTVVAERFAQGELGDMNVELLDRDDHLELNIGWNMDGGFELHFQVQADLSYRDFRKQGYEAELWSSHVYAPVEVSLTHTGLGEEPRRFQIDWSARPEVFEPLIELVLREVPNTLENIKG